MRVWKNLWHEGSKIEHDSALSLSYLCIFTVCWPYSIAKKTGMHSHCHNPSRFNRFIWSSKTHSSLFLKKNMSVQNRKFYGFPCKIFGLKSRIRFYSTNLLRQFWGLQMVLWFFCAARYDLVGVFCLLIWKNIVGLKTAMFSFISRKRRFNPALKLLQIDLRQAIRGF